MTLPLKTWSSVRHSNWEDIREGQVNQGKEGTCIPKPSLQEFAPPFFGRM